MQMLLAGQGHGAWQFTINRDMEVLISDTIRFLLLLTFRKLRNISPLYPLSTLRIPLARKQTPQNSSQSISKFSKTLQHQDFRDYE
jgi:hypothetical protein